jgi:DNA-binding NarL/FixJ family response regulator
MRARILIAERETLVREGLGCLLRAAFRVVGSVGDGRRLLAELERLRPDVLVTGLPELVRGVGAIRGLTKHGDTRVVVVGPDNPQLAAQAFASGASGWVLRTSSVAELIEGVAAAALGRRFLTHEIAGGDVDELDDPIVDTGRIGEVTPRAVEVLRLLAQGKRMKEAAADLGITARTVAFHKYRTMKALGIDSSAELVRYAVRNRMV